MRKFRLLHFLAALLAGLVLFGMPFSQGVALAGSGSVSGDVTASDPTTNRVSTYCSSYVNGVHYDVARFTYTSSGSITINVTAPSSLTWYLYQNAFFPGSPCTNFWDTAFPKTGNGSYTFTMSYGSTFDVLIAGSNSSSTGAWTVSVTGPGTVTVYDPNTLAITSQPSNDTITHNDTSWLWVGASNATGYQWYQGTSGNTSSPIGGATSSSYTTPALAASGSPYQYWVRVSGASGSLDSNTATVTVNKANTTSSITSDSPDPSNIGQAVAVNYTVTSAAGTPTGNVTVSDGVNSCTGTVAAGTCNVTLNTSGARTLTAAYAGDTNFNGSTSSGAAHQVNQPASTTTITSDTPDPSVVGQAVTVNFNVSGSSGTPTGSVSVSDGVNSCSGSLDGSGNGSCAITLTTVGARTLTATYGGDASYSGSSSSGAAHQVDKANTTTSISSDSPDPSVVGQTITVNFSVAAAAPGSGTPSGNVSVSDGTNNCSGSLDGSGNGSCTITYSAVGGYTLTASYGGDGNFNGSTSSGAAHQVNKADTATSISSDSPDPSVVGQAITVNFSVAAAAPGSGTPSGNVSVSDGTNNCSGSLDGSGNGSCTITYAATGAYTLTASYAGDGNFNASTSSGASHQVDKGNSATSISSDSPDPSLVGQNVTVNFSVTSAGGTPTGSVTVGDGVDSCSGNLSGGAGSCVIALSSNGARTLTASYAGDANFNSSTSAGESHTVNFGGVSVSTGTLNITENTAGSSYTLALDDAPSGTVTIQISFDTAELTVNGSSTSPVTLNFNNTTPQTITVVANDNPYGDGSRSRTITQAITSGTAEYPTSLTISDVTVNISDDDTPGVTIDPTSLDLTEGGAAGTYTVALDTPPTSGSVTIDLAFDTSQVTVNSSSTSPVTLTFSDTTPQTVSVEAIDNNAAEGDRSSTITHTITSGPSEYPGSMTISDMTVNILDDDTPGVLVSPRTITLEKSGKIESYTLALRTVPTSGSVTISLAFDKKLVKVNGSSTSPVTVVLNDQTPVTIQVQALNNHIKSRIKHTITSSGAPEYPTTMKIVPVQIRVDHTAFPPPPPVPNARDWNFDKEAPVRTHVPHRLEDTVFVRLIVENGHYVTWFGANLYSDANIGIQELLNHNILQAVDVFDHDFTRQFDGDVVVCLRGMGEMIFMDANEAPHVPRTLTGWMTPSFPGYTCATLYTPGTLVLVEGPPPTIMAPDNSNPQDSPGEPVNCYVTTTNADYVNLREKPDANSAVIAVIPPNEPRWAKEYKDGFYKVQYGPHIGWVSESVVSKDDACPG